MVHMAKLQVERRLSDLYQICERSTFIVLSHWDFGVIYPSEFCQETNHSIWFKWRDSNEGNPFRGVDRGRKGRNTGVRKLFSLLELKRQREEIDLLEPWERVPRRRSQQWELWSWSIITTARRRRRAGTMYPDRLFPCPVVSREVVLTGQTKPECSPKGAQAMLLQGEKGGRVV